MAGSPRSHEIGDSSGAGRHLGPGRGDEESQGSVAGENWGLNKYLQGWGLGEGGA